MLKGRRHTQGKVRRMRPSPFNKTSGQAKAAGAPPAKSRLAPLETSSGDEGQVRVSWLLSDRAQAVYEYLSPGEGNALLLSNGSSHKARELQARRFGATVYRCFTVACSILWLPGGPDEC